MSNYKPARSSSVITQKIYVKYAEVSFDVLITRSLFLKLATVKTIKDRKHFSSVRFHKEDDGYANILGKYERAYTDALRNMFGQN